MTNEHGTPRHWKQTQTTTLASRLTLALPQAIRLLDAEDRDPKRLLEFTNDRERLELAVAEAFRMLYSGHVATVPDAAILFLDGPEHYLWPEESIWHGPLDGDGLSGDAVQILLPPELEKIDLRNVWYLRAPKTGIERITFPYAGGYDAAGEKVAAALFHQSDKKGLRALPWMLQNQGIKEVYFPGTVYRSQWGKPCIHGIVHSNGSWSVQIKNLSDPFREDQPFMYLK